MTAPAVSERARVPMAALDREQAELGGALRAAVNRVLEGGRFILGPEVAAFEAEVGAALDGAHAVGCGNGTDALVLALRALEIGPGDEVIVPGFTFAATAEAVALVGATPVFADIEADTFAIDARSAAALVGPRTRAIIPVHLFGHCVPMEPIRELAERSALRVVEDAAQAIGARCRGRAAGTLGHVAAFSFFPTKNLGAPGDGGLVTTSDAHLAERVRAAARARQPRRARARHDRLQQPTRRDPGRRVARQAAVAGELERQAARDGGAVPRGPRGRRVVAPVDRARAHHIYHQFTVRTPRRDELVARLAAAGVESAVYYPRPLPEQPAYRRWARGPLPEASRASREVLSLPVHPWLRQDEVERVAGVLAAG